ncbi:hypothetical protein CBM2626_B110236 [Cupriavidus taiwanensis]|nr:hypothetical protein CBM2626_B110236 [Cupriavidus taiwanensis]
MRRAGRRQQAGPRAHDEAGEAGFFHGRDIGLARPALGRGDGQHVDLAGLDVRHRHQQRVERHRDLAGHQCRQDRRAAVVGHVGELELRFHRQALAGQVGGAADAAGAEGQRVGMLLAVVDQLGHGLDRQLLAGEQEQWQLGHFRHRHQVGGLVAELRIQRHIGAVGGQHRDKGVAVRRRARSDADAQGAVGTGLVLDDDGLAQPLRDLLEHDPRDRVGGAARGVGHDHLDRLGGPCVGGKGSGGGVDGGHAGNGDGDGTRAARDAMLDAGLQLRLLFGMLGNPLAGPAAGDPAGQLCGTQSVRCRANGG